MTNPENLLAAVERVADDVLWPAALDVDQATRIPDSHYDALANLGLFAMVVPAERDGLGLRPAMVRRVLRTIGRGCGATGFAFAQHHGATAALCRTDNTALSETWVPRLCQRTLAGTAFAHVRRAGPSAIRAEPTADGGWRLTGEAPWATSWGMAEVFTVAAVGPDGEIVWVVVDGHPAEGLVPSEPLPLMVLGSTATVRLRFDGFDVPAAHTVAVEAAEPWRLADRKAAARPNPLCLGVGDRALALLQAAAPDEAAAHAEPWAELCERAEAACVAVDDGTDDIDGVAALRAESIVAVQRLTTALLTAVGGRGAELTHPAQLLARTALFYVIQAQNADGRAATLRALAP